MRLLPYAFLFSLVAIPSARANDSSVGGQGQDLIPERSTAVRMVSEDIRLTLTDGSTTEWRIHATYVFENASDEPVELAMGFPEHRCDREREDDCNGDGAFRDLATTVRGVAVTHRLGAVSRRSPWYTELGRVFVYDVTFAPRETLTIEHRYAFTGDASVFGLGVSYVTRTGRMWNGPIGHARFTVELPSAPGNISAHRTYPLTARRYTPGSTRVAYVYEHTNWTPTENFSFTGFALEWVLLAYDCPTLYLERAPPVGDDAFPGVSDAELRRCRNFPYARHGMPLRDRVLDRALYGRRERIEDVNARLEPFSPDETYEPARLTREDHAYIAAIIAEEQRREAARTSTSPDARRVPTRRRRTDARTAR